MSYLGVISLDTAKTQLRIELDEDANDLEIERMINAACLYIERFTNIHLIPKSKTYYLGSDGFLRVYDFPINDIESGTVAIETKRNLYSRYCGLSNEPFSLNIGYQNSEDVPEDIIQSALEIIAVWFYGSEKNINTTLVPMNVKEVLNTHKRFII